MMAMRATRRFEIEVLCDVRRRHPGRLHSERPADIDRNRWPTSARNARPKSSESAHLSAKMVVVEDHQEWEPSMNEITTIGLDLAKKVFQVHGVDATGAAVLRKRVRRGQVLAFFAGLPCCLVGIEACATAHYWARELRALGHEVRLMPPQYVKA